MHTIDAAQVHRNELGDDIIYSASYITKTSDGAMYDISKQTNGSAAAHHTIIFESEKEFQVFKGYPKLFWDTAEEESRGNFIKVIRVISERGNKKNVKYQLVGTPDVATYEKFGMYHVIRFKYDDKHIMYDVIAPIRIVGGSLSRDTISRINRGIKLFVDINWMAGKGYNDEKMKKLDSELTVEESNTPKRKTKVQKGKSNEKDN